MQPPARNAAGLLARGQKRRGRQRRRRRRQGRQQGRKQGREEVGSGELRLPRHESRRELRRRTAQILRRLGRLAAAAALAANTIAANTIAANAAAAVAVIAAAAVRRRCVEEGEDL